jgi:hypothetical protein
MRGVIIMKKVILTFAAMVLLAAPALADMTVKITWLDGYYTSPGGEFTLTPSGIPSVPNGVPFQTFCVETNEYINIGGTYYVNVNTAAVLGDGGKKAGGNPLTGGLGDPLDARTAYLYTQFRAGTLAGYNYTAGAGRAASAGALQNAIWVIEQETGKVLETDQARAFKAAADAATAPGGEWYAKYGADGIGDVRVLNLYSDSTRTGLCQDQLVLVPAPAAIGLGMLGLALVGWLKRRVG